jgi:pimeloyl-ACP methyl ester carboxylesterase
MFARLLMFAAMRTIVRGLAFSIRGEGGPTVIYLPGAGLVGLDYLNLADDQATHVFYDRGGTGWSSPVPLPRSAADVAGELHDAMPLPGPYILVGHSMGALYARRFAQLFPADVAAMLLLDPGHEDLFAHLPPEAAALNAAMKPDPAQLPDLTEVQLEAARRAYGSLLAAWPAQVRAELIDHHLAHWRTGLSESANLESEVYDEVRHGGAVPDVPVIVLTAGAGNPAWSSYGPPELVEKALAGIRDLHATLAGSFTGGEHRVIEGATHQYAHIEQPEAVRAALRDLIAELD